MKHNKTLLSQGTDALVLICYGFHMPRKIYKEVSANTKDSEVKDLEFEP